MDSLSNRMCQGKHHAGESTRKRRPLNVTKELSPPPYPTTPSGLAPGADGAGGVGGAGGEGTGGAGGATCRVPETHSSPQADVRATPAGFSQHLFWCTKNSNALQPLCAAATQRWQHSEAEVALSSGPRWIGPSRRTPGCKWNGQEAVVAASHVQSKSVTGSRCPPRPITRMQGCADRSKGERHPPSIQGMLANEQGT